MASVSRQAPEPAVSAALEHCQTDLIVISRAVLLDPSSGGLGRDADELWRARTPVLVV